MSCFHNDSPPAVPLVFMLRLCLLLTYFINLDEFGIDQLLLYLIEIGFIGFSDRRRRNHYLIFTYIHLFIFL